MIPLMDGLPIKHGDLWIGWFINHRWATYYIYNMQDRVPPSDVNVGL